MKTETKTKSTATVVRSFHSAIRAKWLRNSDRISVSRLDGHCRIYVKWDKGLDVGENYANAIQQFVDRLEWSGVWVIATTDDGAVAVWKGQE